MSTTLTRPESMRATLDVASDLLDTLITAGVSVAYLTANFHVFDFGPAASIYAQVDPPAVAAGALGLARTSHPDDPRPAFGGDWHGASVSVYATIDTTYGVIDTDTGEVLAKFDTFDVARELVAATTERRTHVAAVSR